MKTLFARLKTALANQKRYRILRDELARLPRDIALDLGLYRGDADAAARKSVWH